MDPRHGEFEALRARAVEIGRTCDRNAYQELLQLLSSEFPTVRRAAAGAMVKLLSGSSIHNSASGSSMSASTSGSSTSADPFSLGGVFAPALSVAMEKEDHEQVLEYMLKAFLLCAPVYQQTDLDLLHDIARNPHHRDYVRKVASEAIEKGEAVQKEREAHRRHWCTRCRKPVTPEESSSSISRYGKPYCRHCLEERRLEDIRFEHDVSAAKVLRTTDGVAVQSRGEKRIGDWLAKEHIAYSYDSRIVVAGDFAMRPDFYLPEFDLYIEYWGLDTPEYLANREKKHFLYQRDRRRLVSLSFHDFNNLEEVLKQKLSHALKP